MACTLHVLRGKAALLCHACKKSLLLRELTKDLRKHTMMDHAAIAELQCANGRGAFVADA
jgi:hypothetical protein